MKLFLLRRYIGLIDSNCWFGIEKRVFFRFAINFLKDILLEINPAALSRLYLSINTDLVACFEIVPSECFQATIFSLSDSIGVRIQSGKADKVGLNLSTNSF